MKLLYAMAFTLFPLAAPAQSPDAFLLTALCHDDYFEDTAGQCKALTAKEDLTLEAILAQYGEIISSDADDESVFYLTDPEEVPVGAIRPWQSTPEDTAGSSHMSARIMSPVPLVSSPDQDLHFVLCDFGHYGRAYVETDPAEADASTIVRKLLQGQ